MKFFSAILAAVLCATVIFAAPPSSPKLSFQDYALSNFDGIAINLECVLHVFDDVFGNSELQGDWVETKTKIQNIVNVEWKKCFDLEEPKQKECLNGVLKEGVHTIGGFIKKVANHKYWPLLNEIRKRVFSECLGNGRIGDEAKQQFREKVKCVIQGISEAVKDTEFAPIWEEYVEHLIDLHERLIACAENSNPVEVGRCILAEIKHDEKIHHEFFKHLKEVSKEDLANVAKYVKGKCFN